METTVTQKGQMVIPSSIRRKLGILDGTRIKVELNEQTNYIILKPITRESIRKFRGILKLKPEGKLASEQLLDDRMEESRREEEKLAKHGAR
ncbi:MAG: AbrB/MazE/SpoVT family DNA-binding domain-containing protein [Ignavibacteriales bacterium]|nr:AbrB/MazE/SpoVT family DNA-binding domain-containing protein [Ignavibacteriales bacterium]